MLMPLLESQLEEPPLTLPSDTSIKTAGPEGNHFYSIYWLAKDYKEHQILQHQPAQSPTSRIWYLSNYHDALQAQKPSPQTRKCQYYSKGS